LAALGAQVEPVLRKALGQTTSEEVRSRIRPQLKALDGRMVVEAEDLRPVRTVQILRRIATARARAVLESLAKGAPKSRETQEAKAALDWLSKRVPATP